MFGEYGIYSNGKLFGVFLQRVKTERKTKVNAEDGKQELLITREFNLPVELLFKAYTESKIVEQWLGTKVLKLENKKHGSWQFETSDP